MRGTRSSDSSAAMPTSREKTQRQRSGRRTSPTAVNTRRNPASEKGKLEKVGKK